MDCLELFTKEFTSPLDFPLLFANNREGSLLWHLLNGRSRWSIF